MKFMSKFAYRLLGFMALFVFISFPKYSAAQTSGASTYKFSNYQSRDTTQAARRMDPKLGQTKETTLRKSNPYEARKVSIIRQEEKYELALKNWERKVEAVERKAIIKRQKEEERELARLRKEQQRKLDKESRSAKKPEGRFQPLASLLFGSKKSEGSSPTLKPVTTVKSELPSVEVKTATTAPANIDESLPDTTEEPSFFQRLKWALFGK
ncbi:MAG: hypothetical protein IT292_12275 [Deltaproteobacteria bacterium]|nr:hypothetical protein [Deltaproteobacteria bacterium]